MDIVIALIGAKGAGKTTAFNAMQDLLDVQEITLASKLKDVSSEVFNVPRIHFDSHAFKEKDLEDPVFLTAENVSQVFEKYDLKPNFDKYIRPHIGKVLHTPRQIAQYIGTEVLRTYNPDIHCDEAVKRVTNRVGVVTDMRFPNEYSYFKEKYPKFYPIYINNIGAEVAASKDTHASEAYLKDLAKKAVKTLPNNSSIKEFQESVRKYLREIAV